MTDRFDELASLINRGDLRGMTDANLAERLRWLAREEPVESKQEAERELPPLTGSWGSVPMSCLDVRTVTVGYIECRSATLTDLLALLPKLSPEQQNSIADALDANGIAALAVKESKDAKQERDAAIARADLVEVQNQAFAETVEKLRARVAELEGQTKAQVASVATAQRESDRRQHVRYPYKLAQDWPLVTDTPIPPGLAAGLKSAKEEPLVDLGDFTKYAEEGASVDEPQPGRDNTGMRRDCIPLASYKERRPHIVDGEFQSDKYPTCPHGKVPLSVKDPTAQDLLWEYAQRRRGVDSEFADDLEFALLNAGHLRIVDPPTQEGEEKAGCRHGNLLAYGCSQCDAANDREKASRLGAAEQRIAELELIYSRTLVDRGQLDNEIDRLRAKCSRQRRELRRLSQKQRNMLTDVASLATQLHAQDLEWQNELLRANKLCGELSALRAENEHLKKQAGAANDHRKNFQRARADWIDAQQAIKWCRGRISFLEDENEKLRAREAPARSVVMRFAVAMERKLRLNDHKGDWLNCEGEYLLGRLQEEVDELKRAWADLSPNPAMLRRVTDESADVANLAMMIADKFGDTPAPQPPQEAPAETSRCSLLPRRMRNEVCVDPECPEHGNAEPAGTGEKR